MTTWPRLVRFGAEEGLEKEEGGGKEAKGIAALGGTGEPSPSRVRS